MSITSFDVFLETAGPGGAARAKAMGIEREDVSRLQETYAKLVRVGVARDAVLASLGSPSMQSQTSLCYALPSKPGYMFRFLFDASGKLEKASFVVAPSDEMRARPGELAESASRLKGMGATEDEILAWYGEPDEVSGWWPVETWSYGKTHLELKLGIVC